MFFFIEPFLVPKFVILCFEWTDKWFIPVNIEHNMLCYIHSWLKVTEMCRNNNWIVDSVDTTGVYRPSGRGDSTRLSCFFFHTPQFGVRCFTFLLGTAWPTVCLLMFLQLATVQPPILSSCLLLLFLFLRLSLSREGGWDGRGGSEGVDRRNRV